MELNPILRREIRARWRKWPAFAVVFGYATAVTIAMGCALAVQTPVEMATRASDGANLAALGHDLFARLTWLETLAWMLLAPFLTATAIAGERERGTLALVQLSPLTPLRIISGKLLSALSFIAVMLLVPLPATAVCFCLGGVSPGEFIIALGLHTVTATTGALIGLNCSAWSRSAGSAVRATVTALAVLNLGCLYFSFLLRDLHPLVAALDIFDTSQDIPLWTLNFVAQELLSVFLLWNATCALQQSSQRQATFAAPLPTAMAVDHTPSSGTGLDSTQAGFSDTMYIGEAAAFPYVRWYRLPPSGRWRFANAVLQREVRRRLSIRQDSAYGEFDTLPGSIYVVAFSYGPYLFCLWALEFLKPDLRGAIWWMHFYLWLPIAVVAAAIMGALAFVQERERNMLEPLLLSALSPTEIILGKLAAILLACGYYSLPLGLLLLPCLSWAPASEMHGIAPAQALATLLLALTATGCGASIGLLVSWCCRTTLVAIPATVVALALISAGVVCWSRPDLGHPGSNLLAVSLLAPCALFGVGCTSLICLRYAMRHGVRQPDRMLRLWHEG